MSTGQGKKESAEHTLCLEALVAFFHDAKSGVVRKVIGPHSDEHQSSIPDFIMGGLYGAELVRSTAKGEKS